MNILINPGSHVQGGTEAQALENARQWLSRMEEDGFTDIELDETPLRTPPENDSDRWTFTFRHTLTGRTALLTAHGLSEGECREMFFYPRTYWNGSSCSEPKWQDFLTHGFEVAIRVKHMNGGGIVSDDLLKPECELPVFRGIIDLDSIDPRSVRAGVVVTNFRNAMKYEPVCFALNAITERLLFGETPMPQEIEDAKEALAECGFRVNWELRDYAPGVYGFPEGDDE